MNNNDIQILDKQTIESMIYTIRGQKVMLDFDLARIYGYETKNFNRQVLRNIEKFPDRYRFQLTEEEIDNFVRCQNVTSRIWGLGNTGGRRYSPYAFTEQGIYMLMTVLKGDLATKQSIALIDTFKAMKDYIIENNSLCDINEILKLNNIVNEHSNKIDVIENKLNVVMKNFIDEDTYKHFVFQNGKKIEADVAIQSIFKRARNSITIVDDYIDIKTLQLLKIVKEEVKIIIVSDNKGRNSINKNFINDFKKDTKLDISFKKNDNLFHDRYIFLDHSIDSEEIYHLGGSIKDAGGKVSAISRVNDVNIYKEIIEEALNHENIEIE